MSQRSGSSSSVNLTRRFGIVCAVVTRVVEGVVGCVWDNILDDFVEFIRMMFSMVVSHSLDGRYAVLFFS